MVRLQIGWCRNCPHKVGLHPDHPEWRHFGVGHGYLLSVNCLAYAGSTNTALDRGALHEGQFKCGCVSPVLDPGRPTETKWVLV